MSQTIAYLEAIVGADLTSFRRGMAEVRSELTATSGLAGGLTSLGTALTLGITVPLVAIGVAGVKAFSDIDSALRNVNSIAQLSEDQFQSLQDRIVEYGAGIREGAVGAANALYTIVSSGFGLNDINEAFKVMDVAVRTAEAGLANTEITTQALVSALLAYGKGAESAASFSDILTRSVAVGVGTMEQFAGSVGLVLPTAALLGVNFRELSETAAFLTQRGLSFSEAFVSLNGVFRTLIKPGEELQKVFAELGVSGGEALIEKFGGLEGALKAIASVADVSSEGLSKLFTEIRAYRGAASILGNLDAYTSLVNEFGEAVDGATDRAHQEQVKSLAYAFDLLKSKFLSALAQIGEKLAPMFLDIVKGLSDFLDMIVKLDPEVLKTAVSVGLLVAALPPLVLILGTILSPIGLVVTGIVALAHAINTNFLGVGDTFRKVWTAVSNFVEGMVQAFSSNDPNSASAAFNNFIESGMSTENAVKWTKFFTDLGDGVRYFIAGFEVNLINIAGYIDYYVRMWESRFLDFVGLLTARNPFSIRGALESVGVWIEQHIIAPVKGMWLLIQPYVQPFIDFWGITITGKIGEVNTTLATLQAAFIAFWTPIQTALQPLVDWFTGVMRDVIQPFIDMINQALDSWEMLSRLGGADPSRALPNESAPGVPFVPGYMPPMPGGGGVKPPKSVDADIWQRGGWGIGNFDDFNRLAGGYDPYSRSRDRDRQPAQPPILPTPNPIDHWRGNSGMGTYGTNNIVIQSTDPDAILRELRRRGIDLDANRRG